MSNGKDMIIHLIAGFIKKLNQMKFFKMQFHCIKMSQYFPKPYEPFGGDINVKVNLSNYATTASTKSFLHIDTSSFALKSNLSSLKTVVKKQILTNSTHSC